MYNFYSKPKHLSQTVDNFLDQGTIDKILKSYFVATDIFSEFYQKKYHIAEINISPNLGVKTFRIKNSRGREICIEYEKKFKPINKIKKKKLFSWTNRICAYLEELFAKQDIPARIVSLNVHNLASWIEIHCDGVDITNKEPRPEEFPHFDPKKYFPENYLDYAHQGLITLQNSGTKNGTIIFDQWFPISTYIEQDKNFDTHKANIRFFKGEPLERFGESVREYTNQPMPEEDYNKIVDVIGSDSAFSREKSFGFTLDNILFFGKPGTLNVWATKKYHTPIPLPKPEWSNQRILLQYEAVYA